MIQFAKQMNLEFQKNEERRVKLNNRFTRRRQYLAQVKQTTFNQYSHQMFVDPVSLYLYLTLNYWRRVEKRSVKTMSLEMHLSNFIDQDSVFFDEIFEKVIKQFAKHQIKMSVKTREVNGKPVQWKISLKTLELY